MNRYFNDARYHAKRAGESFTKGVRVKAESAVRMFRSRMNQESESESTRTDMLREKARSAERTARRKARNARSRIRMTR